MTDCMLLHSSQLSPLMMAEKCQTSPHVQPGFMNFYYITFSCFKEQGYLPLVASVQSFKWQQEVQMPEKISGNYSGFNICGNTHLSQWGSFKEYYVFERVPINVSSPTYKIVVSTALYQFCQDDRSNIWPEICHKLKTSSCGASF